MRISSLCNIQAFCILFCILFCVDNMNAQSGYTIDQGGSISTCYASFFDSDSTLNYQDNENYTITFCTNGGGNIINVGFAFLFDIDPSDTLFIYDGNSTTSPLIGAYNNNNIPPGLSSTTSNGSGCLTFQFVSDGAITGAGWSASLNCINICQPIVATITTIPALISYGPDSNYTNICPGDSVIFNVSTVYSDNGINPFNYTQSDATSTFEWALGTGNVVTTQSATETYLNPQGYLIILKITDVNGCIETVRHKVRTGIPPIFSGVFASPDTACFGDTVNLVGGFNQTTTSVQSVSSSTGTIAAGGIVTGQTFLPDGSGQSYTTSVNINGFSGQTIANGTDIDEICMNIEHSYIGDLTITLTCPNGTTIILSDTYNAAPSGPGNTFLGDADDNGLTNPGIGMDYCFDMSATWGTMNTENINSNWVPSTVTPGNNILTPGSFQPEQSFNNLIGCPIDGNWSITVTDNLGADNGYIFEWGILLNPAINPNVEYYTPNLLTGIWLNNPDIFVDYDTLALAIPSIVGDNSYIFQVTDEYGCTFDTTINVNIISTPPVNAGNDTTLCTGGTMQLNATPIGAPPAPCNYTIDMYDTFGDGWNGFEIEIIINGVSLGNFTFINGATNTDVFSVSSGDNIVINTISGVFDSEVSYQILDCIGNVIFSDGVNYTGNNPLIGNNINNFVGASPAISYNYSWTPTTGLSNPNIANPTFTVTATTTYVVEMWETNYQSCASFDTIVITPIPVGFFAGNDGDTTLCRTYGSFDMFTLIGGGPNLGGQWIDTANNPISNIFDPAIDVSGTYMYYVGAGSCGDTAIVTILNPDSVLLSNTSPDTTICVDGTANIYTTGTGGTGILSLIWDNALVGNGPHNVTPTDSTVYTVYAQDTLGCISSINTITVTLFDSITIAVIPSDTVCSTSPGNTASLTANANGGDGNGFTYEWRDGNNNIVGNTQTVSVTPSTSPETFTVYVGDNCTTPIVAMTVDIYYFNPIVPIFSSNTIGDCYPVNVAFTNNTVSNDMASALWTFGDGNTSTSLLAAPNNYTSPGCYTVGLEITSTDGCVSYSDSTNMICAYDYPFANFIMTPQPTFVPFTEITFENTSSIDATSYLWTVAGQDTFTSDNLVYEFAQAAAEYNVCLLISNNNNCTDENCQTVVIKEELHIFIPNTFTPNSDNLNEVFRPVLKLDLVVEYTFMIFDRWGELIFTTNDVTKGWDGTYKGGSKLIKTGTYVYKVKVKDSNFKHHNYVGSVNLVK